jgi:HSP20 family protein
MAADEHGFFPMRVGVRDGFSRPGGTQPDRLARRRRAAKSKRRMQRDLPRRTGRHQSSYQEDSSTQNRTSTSKEENIMRSLIHYTNPRSASLVPAFGFALRSPWTGLESDIDRLFASTLSGFMAPVFDNRFPVDLYEDADNTYVRAELPGVNRDEINVEMVDGYLTISGSRKGPAAEGPNEETFSFSRSVNIPNDVQADKVSAAYENGVLTITLPKKEEAKPRKITVAVK